MNGSGGGIIWSPGMSLAAMEKLIILEAYRFFRWNKTAASSSLGIAVRTLDNKLDQYQLEEDAEKERFDAVERTRADELARHRGTPPNNLGIPYSPGLEIQKSQSLSSPPSGLCVEPAAHAASQPALSVPQRKEVQTVLSPHAPPSPKGKGR